jgi:hypothetical protein
MNSNTDVVRIWHDESWTNPPSSVIKANEMYLSDDFQGFDKDGNLTGNKAGMNAMAQVFFAAFEGFKGVVHGYQEQEDGAVLMTFHFEGTHTTDLDLSAMGLGVIPATGIRFSTPESSTRFMVEGGQIISSHPVSGGFEHVLAAIGAIPAE